jgi:hypothetical protein
MRRIGLLLLGLCLTVGIVGCAEDTTTTPPAGTDTTTPPGDADADGTGDAADDAPADPAAK